MIILKKEEKSYIESNSDVFELEQTNESGKMN